MTANEITLATQTLFSELVQRSLDADFDERYDERGNFIRRRRKNALYWYYQRFQGGKLREEYVGPVRDSAINERVKRFDSIKNDYKQRREMVRAMLAAGLPSPDPMSCLVVEALWKAGFFRLRGVLIGTAAFHCYAGTLGVRLQGATLMTQDADFAQFYDVSHAVGDSIPPILDVLRKLDQTFEPILGAFDSTRAARFRNKDHYLVEFLTPNRGSDDHMDKIAEMPALGGASAIPLRYLDYLIHEPIRSVLLFKGAIPVTIPAPERFAVHKLIVAAVRHSDSPKSRKDIAQAEQIFQAMLARRSFALREAWEEAWRRGPQWRENLRRGLDMLSAEMRENLEPALKLTERKGHKTTEEKAPVRKQASRSTGRHGTPKPKSRK